MFPHCGQRACGFLKCQTAFISDDFIIYDVYAKCSRSDMLELWEDLNNTSQFSLPWMVGGDFNIVRKSDERLGGKDNDLLGANDSNDCISSCDLIEILFFWEQIYMAKD